MISREGSSNREIRDISINDRRNERFKQVMIDRRDKSNNKMVRSVGIVKLEKDSKGMYVRGSDPKSKSKRAHSAKNTKNVKNISKVGGKAQTKKTSVPLKSERCTRSGSVDPKRWRELIGVSRKTAKSVKIRKNAEDNESEDEVNLETYEIISKASASSKANRTNSDSPKIASEAFKPKISSNLPGFIKILPNYGDHHLDLTQGSKEEPFVLTSCLIPMYTEPSRILTVFEHRGVQESRCFSEGRFTKMTVQANECYCIDSNWMVVRDSFRVILYRNGRLHRELPEKVRGVAGMPWLVPNLLQKKVFFKTDTGCPGIVEIGLDFPIEGKETVKRIPKFDTKDTEKISNFCSPSSRSPILVSIDHLGEIYIYNTKLDELTTSSMLKDSNSPNLDLVIGFKSCALQTIESDRYVIARRYNGRDKPMDIFVIDVEREAIKLSVNRESSLLIFELIEIKNILYLVTCSSQTLTIKELLLDDSLKTIAEISVDSIEISKFGKIKGRSVNQAVYIFNHFVKTNNMDTESNHESSNKARNDLFKKSNPEDLKYNWDSSRTLQRMNSPSAVSNSRCNPI